MVRLGALQSISDRAHSGVSFFARNTLLKRLEMPVLRRVLEIAQNMADCWVVNLAKQPIIHCSIV